MYTFRAKVQAYASPRFTTVDATVLFSPGDPVSIMLPNRKQGQPPILIRPTPYRELSWLGVPARLAWLGIGLPVVGSDTLRPFRLLALLPLQDVEDVPPVIRLGAEFLHAHRADVHLSAATGEGRLVIPYP